MTNVQQPEMRRNEHNPTVQDSKVPRPNEHRVAGGKNGGVPRGQTTPRGQTSPYGPAPRPVAADDSELETAPGSGE
jgi:hypothetical protein